MSIRKRGLGADGGVAPTWKFAASAVAGAATGAGLTVAMQRSSTCPPALSRNAGSEEKAPRDTIALTQFGAATRTWAPRVLRPQTYGSGAVVIYDEEQDQNQERIQMISNNVLVGSIGGWTVHPETLRMVAYLMFWIMVGIAMVTTTLFVDVDLEQSPLVETFGFNNICIYWDYSPSLELTAAVYPIVEFPLLGYVMLKFIRDRQLWQEERITGAHYAFCCMTFPVEVILVVAFRLIFVIRAFEHVLGHTMPFLGLQTALGIILVKNRWLHHALDSLAFLGPVHLWLYKFQVVLALGVIAVKLYHNMMLLTTGTGLVNVSSDFGRFVAKTLDDGFMLLLAVFPFFTAARMRKGSQALSFSVRLQ